MLVVIFFWSYFISLSAAQSPEELELVLGDSEFSHAGLSLDAIEVDQSELQIFEEEVSREFKMREWEGKYQRIAPANSVSLPSLEAVSEDTEKILEKTLVLQLKASIERERDFRKELLRFEDLLSGGVNKKKHAKYLEVPRKSFYCSVCDVRFCYRNKKGGHKGQKSECDGFPKIEDY